MTRTGTAVHAAILAGVVLLVVLPTVRPDEGPAPRGVRPAAVSIAVAQPAPPTTMTRPPAKKPQKARPKRPGKGRPASWALRPPDPEAVAAAERRVVVRVTPPMAYSFAVMEPGVLQHLDRRYTYDVVPDRLLGGLLFQGIHRPPKGTSVSFELREPATVYVFFHPVFDGGYGRIFEELTREGAWRRSPDFPQYDTLRGKKHGLKMVMFERDAGPGTWAIPPTTAARGCFSLVFQFGDRGAGQPR